MGSACAGVGKSTLLLQVAAMLGSGTTPSAPQSSLVIEEESLEDDLEKEDDEETDYSGEEDEEEETDEEELVEAVGAGSASPGQAVLYVSAEESVEQASCRINPCWSAVNPRIGLH